MENIKSEKCQALSNHKLTEKEKAGIAEILNYGKEHLPEHLYRQIEQVMTKLVSQCSNK